MRRTLVLLATAALLTGPSAPSFAQSKSSDSKITIYHIEGSRGERVVWLCEELGIPYTLEVTPGNLMASMQTIRTVNPAMPVSPTVKIGNQLMVESGGILEVLVAREGKGKLIPAVNSPDFLSYKQWMHFAEGSLAARIFSDYRLAQAQGANAQRQPGVSGLDTLKFADGFLSTNQYFGGKEFSAADIMMLFPIVYSERLKLAKLSDYPNIIAWQKRVEARPAFQRMVKVARPQQ